MTVRILIGDAREQLATLPDESVHCVVTSPPYFGLRDYGTAQWVGGDALCGHGPSYNPRSDRPRNGLTGGTATVDVGTVRRGDCSCGARRIDRQLGLESSPAEYVEAMVSVFRDVRRVLRNDGVLFLNIGDSYASGGRRSRDPGQSKIHPAFEGEAYPDGLRPLDPPGIKPKDLIGIPWMLAFALRADGWYLRQDIIWSKPNPMPESVTDRCTKAHEYLFLLAKSERYYYDADAIAEESIRAGDIPKGSHKHTSDSVNDGRIRQGLEAHALTPVADYRNKRSVWTVATAPYSDAHFATFPPALIEPCILAGSPVGGTVLDPFFGAGTTGLVSDRLRRDCIGIELNPAYAEMARRRIEGDAGLFAEVAAE